VKIVNLELRIKDNTLISTILIISFILYSIAIYLLINPANTLQGKDKFIPSILAFILALTTTYLYYRYRADKKLHRIWIDLVNKIVLGEKRIELPEEINNVSEVEVDLYRGIYRGEYRVSLNYRETENKYGRVLELREIKPYLFIALKRTRRNRVEYGEIYYNGMGYYFRYRGIKFLLLPLHVIKPKPRNTHLRVMHERDYGEAYIESRDNSLLVKLYYTREDSRELRLELTSETAPEYLLDIKLCSISESGNKECIIEFPVLADTHLIIIPINYRYVADSMFKPEEFIYKGELLDDKLIIGYKDLELKLTLDIPYARDVSVKTSW